MNGYFQLILITGKSFSCNITPIQIFLDVSVTGILPTHRTPYNSEKDLLQRLER
jgi:hypothetical protein